MIRDSATLTMADYPSSPFFNERPISHVSMSHQYSTLNIPLTVQDRHILRPTTDN